MKNLIIGKWEYSSPTEVIKHAEELHFRSSELLKLPNFFCSHLAFDKDQKILVLFNNPSIVLDVFSVRRKTILLHQLNKTDALLCGVRVGQLSSSIGDFDVYSCAFEISKNN